MSKRKTSTKKATKATKKSSPGRPIKMTEEMKARIVELAEGPYTLEGVARKAGVGLQTIRDHMLLDESFSCAINEAREKVDREVESALLKAAMGFHESEQVALVVSDGKDLGSHVEIETVEKYHKPSTTAQIFWLKNRQPKRWRDRSEVLTKQVTELSDEQLEEFARANGIKLDE